ncbi:hypothetical protein NNRS527_02650 [Nitrosospira sp. NRS527]|nr:hypothetical protein NNRS527_02650 [Nitrosospira sp. NRS527]
MDLADPFFTLSENGHFMKICNKGKRQQVRLYNGHILLDLCSLLLVVLLHISPLVSSPPKPWIVP